MEKATSAHTILAFAVVELGAQLPLDTIYNMSMHPADPLYTELVDMWTKKQEREDKRVCQLCAAIYNSVGGKKDGGQFTADDFFPQKPKTQEQVEAEFKARLLMYHTAKVEE